MTKWKLVNCQTGNVLRKNAKDQWELLVSCSHRDGERYTKTEALTVPSGSVVYKRCGMTKMVDMSNVKFGGQENTGHNGRFYVKRYFEQLVAYYLISEDETVSK